MATATQKLKALTAEHATTTAELEKLRTLNSELLAELSKLREAADTRVMQGAGKTASLSRILAMCKEAGGAAAIRILSRWIQDREPGGRLSLDWADDAAARELARAHGFLTTWNAAEEKTA